METVGATRVNDARAKLADFYSKQPRRSKTDDSEKRVSQVYHKFYSRIYNSSTRI